MKVEFELSLQIRSRNFIKIDWENSMNKEEEKRFCNWGEVNSSVW